MTTPLVFNEYFERKDEAASPFLTQSARKWGKGLSLKAALFSALLLFISFLPGVPTSFSHLLLCFIYFMVGVPPLIEAINDLANFDINIDVLMTLAAFASVLIGSGFEGALLLVLFALSGAMEETVEGKAKEAISSLKKLSPKKACVITEEGLLIDRAIQDVKLGSRILIKSQEMVPLDGIVIEGETSLNLAHLTGESLPQRKTKGDVVPAGANNLEGAITVQVTHTSQDSTLAKIIALVTEAEEAKPVLQRWFDTLSQSYATTIILFSFAFALLTPWLFSLPFLGEGGSLYRALAFLIAASPCALIIAIPIAYLSALGVLAKNGILLKGGVILDRLASCSMIAFDKTGTVTTGELVLQDITCFDSTLSEAEALTIAYTLERNAVHPIARAILSASEKQGLSPLPVHSFTSIPGYGLQGIISFKDKERDVFIGLPEFLDVPKSLQEKIQETQNEGLLIALLKVDQTLFLFRFQDQLRPGIKKTLQSLKNKFHLKLALLSGDRSSTVTKMGKALGFDVSIGELRPEDKLHQVGKLAQNISLAMVGDGINDAPALARADVGIAMGKVGSAAAVDAADIILLKDTTELLDWLFQKAIQTRRIVKQNVSIASLAIVLASLPALLGYLPLWLAVILHEGGTVLVGLNALRLLSKKSSL